MPLDPAEAITLSADVVALVAALRDALDPDSPGARRITRDEGRVLLRQSAELTAALAAAALD